MRALHRSVMIAGLALIFSGTPAVGQSSRKALSNPEPVFPELARRMHISGIVKVAIVIGADGQIKNTEFQGGHPVLIDAVQSALKQWKYAPAASESRILLEFKF